MIDLDAFGVCDFFLKTVFAEWVLGNVGVTEATPAGVVATFGCRATTAFCWPLCGQVGVLVAETTTGRTAAAWRVTRRLEALWHILFLCKDKSLSTYLREACALLSAFWEILSACRFFPETVESRQTTLDVIRESR